MRKTITALSLVAALLTASSVPATSASPAEPEPPATCAQLVQDFAAKLKQAIASLLPAPNVAAAKPLIGDLLELVDEMQDAECLPTTPVSAPGTTPAKAFEQADPADQCLAAVLNLIAGVAGVGGAVLSGADAAKITGMLKELLKTAEQVVDQCGLPAPSGGMPALGGPVPVGSR